MARSGLAAHTTYLQTTSSVALLLPIPHCHQMNDIGLGYEDLSGGCIDWLVHKLNEKAGPPPP